MSQTMGAVESMRGAAGRVGEFLSRIVLPRMESASEDWWQEVLTWLAELRSVEIFPTLALPYVLLYRPAESAAVENTIEEDLASDNEDAITAAVQAVRHWVHLSAVKGVPEVPPNLITALVQRVALRREAGIVSSLVHLTRLVFERPAALTLSHAKLLSAALIPWHEATKGDQGASGGLGDQENSNLRVGVGQLAGALKIVIVYRVGRADARGHDRAVHAEWARSGADFELRVDGIGVGDGGEESVPDTGSRGTRLRILFLSGEHSRSVSRSIALRPCCLAVARMLVSTACARAPFSVRLPPQFLRTTTRNRRTRSTTDWRQLEFPVNDN